MSLFDKFLDAMRLNGDDDDDYEFANEEYYDDDDDYEDIPKKKTSRREIKNESKKEEPVAKETVKEKTKPITEVNNSENEGKKTDIINTPKNHIIPNNHIFLYKT